jgi:putative component of toxin-antitoxin plasmid stabilization module
MSKFALETIDSISGKQVFEKLIIDETCQFDEFEKRIVKNPKYKSELASLYLYMEEVAKGNSLPKRKFKDITPDKETVKEYEFKSNNLRIYAIKKENGKIIILAGTKNKQNKDIRKFRGIKKRYLEYIDKK